MKRITLFYWNSAEGEERAALLRSEGYEVDLKTKVVPAELRALGTRPPDAFVIDLGRLPSQGREIAGALRRQKATRFVPIVFSGTDKTGRVRELLPDAIFTDWPHLAGALQQAFESPLAKPVVPGTMAGYSGTPLPKKLGIKDGSGVTLLGAPDSFAETLGVPFRKGGEVILLFVRSRAELTRRFPAAAKQLAQGGRLWIIWPKKASRVVTDLTETEVRAHGLAAGYVDYKICAVDAVWSGLCFALRKGR